MPFLPTTKKEMEQRGIRQMDFVYVIGDAYVITLPSARQSSAVCWNPGAIRWEFCAAGLEKG